MKSATNKRFKRDFQRVAFLLCVGFSDYGVMRKLGSSVVSPLSGRLFTKGAWFCLMVCLSTQD